MVWKSVFKLTLLSMALLNAGMLCAQSVGASIAPSNLAVPLGSNAQIGISNANNTSELSAAVTLGEGDIRMRLAGDISKEQQHALAGIGIQYQNGYAIVGGSYARELMAEYDKKLTANSKFIEAGVANPVAGILRAFVKLHQKDAQDKHLDTRVATTQSVTVQDILTVFDTPTATTYRNTRKVTTTDTTTTTHTDFVWGKSQTVTLGADFAVTPATKLSLMAYHARTQIPGGDTQTQTTGAVAFTEYFPSQSMNATLGYASSGRIALGAEKTISEGWTAKMTGFADTKGANRRHGVYVGANYSFGWTAANPGKMLLTTGDQFAEALRQLDTSSAESVRNVQGLGRVAVTHQIAQTQRMTETVSEYSIDKPKPPVDKSAPVITLTGASTINLIVGNTYAELGATCVDDKDTTCTVVISGTVNTALAGTYIVTYTATDSAGNVSINTRTVVVGNVIAPPDTTPDAFTFVDQTGVALSSVITSAPITISGITAPSPISITGGEYSIAGGVWTSTPGTVTNNQTVAVRGTSSASNSTAKAVTLTVGGVSDTFDITTVAAIPEVITPPTVNNPVIGDISGSAPITINIGIAGSNKPGAILTYEIVSITAPSTGFLGTFTLNPSSHTISWTYDAGWLTGTTENLNITIKVTSSIGGSITYTVIQWVLNQG